MVGLEQKLLGGKMPWTVHLKHADQKALMAWASGFSKPPKRTFVVHGEAAAANNFAQQLRTEKNWAVDVPVIGQSYQL